MSEPEIILNIVAKFTGISKEQICSRSRVWPLAEARMLFALFCSRKGFPDQRIAWMINRARVSALKIRKSAERYISVSRVFSEKFDKISEYYESLQVFDAEKQV